VRRFRDFQLPFYYWRARPAGDRVSKLVLIPLKDAPADVRPVVLEVGKTIKLDDLGDARENDRTEHATGAGEIRRFEPTKNAAALHTIRIPDGVCHKAPAEAQRFGS